MCIFMVLIQQEGLLLLLPSFHRIWAVLLLLSVWKRSQKRWRKIYALNNLNWNLFRFKIIEHFDLQKLCLWGFLNIKEGVIKIFTPQKKLKIYLLENYFYWFVFYWCVWVNSFTVVTTHRNYKYISLSLYNTLKLVAQQPWWTELKC